MSSNGSDGQTEAVTSAASGSSSADSVPQRRLDFANAKSSRDDRIARRYAHGHHVVDIARAEGVCEKTVRSVARRSGVPLRRPDQTDRNQRIARRYSAGEPVSRIATDEGVRRPYVRTVAKRLGLPPRHGWQRRYPIDEHAFDQPDQVGWWLIGLLAADGCVNETEHRVSLAQRAEDADVLTAFLTYVGSAERPLVEIRRGNSASAWSRPDGRYLEARIFSRTICNALATHGVLPRKSLSLTLGTRAAREAAVWLGLLDGDGSVGLHRQRGRPRIDFFGTPSVMRQCSEFWGSRLTLTTGQPPSIVRHRGGLCKVALHGSNAARGARIMLDATPVSLVRKRQTLREIAKEGGSRDRVSPATETI